MYPPPVLVEVIPRQVLLLLVPIVRQVPIIIQQNLLIMEQQPQHVPHVRLHPQTNTLVPHVLLQLIRYLPTVDSALLVNMFPQPVVLEVLQRPVPLLLVLIVQPVRILIQRNLLIMEQLLQLVQHVLPPKPINMFPLLVQLQQILYSQHVVIVLLVSTYQQYVMMALLIPREQLPPVPIVLLRHTLLPPPIMDKQLQPVQTIVLYVLLAYPKQLVRQQQIGVVVMNVLLASTLRHQLMLKQLLRVLLVLVEV
jgi:hypothetical protein